MSLLRSKDASLVAAPGTGDVGGFGVELLGGDHDLVVGAALSLVTCDDITVTEVPCPRTFRSLRPSRIACVNRPCSSQVGEIAMQRSSSLPPAVASKYASAACAT